MQPLYGTVSAGGKGVSHRILLREECPIAFLGAGENPSLTLATDDCNVPDKREALWCPACVQRRLRLLHSRKKAWEDRRLTSKLKTRVGRTGR